MQPVYPPEADTYRATVRSFLADNLPKDWRGIGALEGEALENFVADWRVILHKNGYLAPDWPKEYGGGGLTSLEMVVLNEEFARAGVPTGGPNDVFGIQMLGNTILRWGTEEQKKHNLPRIQIGRAHV